MTGAHAVSPNRPSTRQRSTRGIELESRVRPKSTRQARPSTRSTRGAAGETPAGIHTQRRTGSTRNKPSTRKPSTRAGNPSSESSTRSTENRRERQETKQGSEKRHPVQLFSEFIIVSFFIVVVSVFAFGLLRGESSATQDERPDPSYDSYEKVYNHKGTTSTNTGILRGDD